MNKLLLDADRRHLKTGYAVLSLALLTLFGTVTGVSAQDAPRLEVSAGYAALWDRGRDEALPKGIYASAAWRLTRWLSVVGEVGRHSKSKTFADTADFVGFVFEQDVTTILGGARFVPWSSSRIVAFAEILVGSRRGEGHVWELRDPTPGPLGFDVQIDLTDPALQPGGGIVLWFHPRVGAQVLLHYRRTIGRSVGDLRLPDISEWRGGTGLTIGLW